MIADHHTVQPVALHAVAPQKIALQRASGLGELSLRVKDGRSRIFRLFQEGSAKIRMPQVTGDPLEAILINTSGGLTGGDRLQWSIELDEYAAAVLTTQACERIYRSSGGKVRIATRLKLASRANLAWLPQETILFDQSALTRSLDVEMAQDAQVLLVEATQFGRLAMGERVSSAHFHDRWRVRVEGRVVHAEDVRLGPDLSAQLPITAVANGALALATVLFVSPNASSHLDAARAIVGEDGGCSVWQVGPVSKLAMRLHAPDSYTLRKRLGPLLASLNGKSGLPKAWTL